MKEVIEAARLLSVEFGKLDMAGLLKRQGSSLLGIITDTLSSHRFDRIKKMMRRGLESGVYKGLFEGGTDSNNLREQVFTLTDRELFSEDVARRIIAVFLLALDFNEENTKRATSFVNSGEWLLSEEVVLSAPKSDRGTSFGYRVFDKCITGGSHTKEGKVCQDYSTHYSDDRMCIGIVADGHGSADHFRSDRGSQLAAKTALAVLIEATNRMLDMDPGALARLISENGKDDGRHPVPGCMFDTIKLAIVKGWRANVDADFQAHPFTEEELSQVQKKYIDRLKNQNIYYWAYGTTLIASVVTEKFWFAIQIGNGRCVVLSSEHNDNYFVEQMPTPHQSLNGNDIYSIWQIDAVEGFRHFASFNVPKMVIVHTDGIDDSLYDNASLDRVYSQIGGSFAQGIESAEKNIETNILSKMASIWKGDDTSIAMTYIATEELAVIADMLCKRSSQSLEKEKYNRAKNRLVELEAVIKVMTEAVARQQKAIGDAKARHIELGEQFKQVSDELAGYEAHIAELRDRREQIKAQAEEIKARGMGFESSKKAMSSELEAKKKELDSIRESIEAYEKKNGIG